MKRIVSCLLMVIIVASCTTFIPLDSYAKISYYYYTAQDFETTDEKAIEVTNEADDTSANKKYRITGEEYDWYTSQYTASNSPSFSYKVAGSDSNNATGFLYSTGKNQFPNLTMEMVNKTTGEKEAASGPEGVVYVDMRLYRNPSQISTNQDIYLYDSNGKNIASVYLPQASAPLINGTNKSTGTEADASCTESSKSKWFYLQFILDFNLKTFKANMGVSLDAMEPCHTTVTDYNFKDLNVSDFYSIQFGKANLAKGAMCIDDFRVYAITGLEKPVASIDVKGNATIGSVIKGSYTYKEDYQNTPESGSLACWQRSDALDFKVYEAVGESFSSTANTEYEYTITDKDSGKYIRLCVIPSTMEGTKGEACYSPITNQIDVFDVVIDGNGAFVDSQFDIDDGIGAYGGEVTAYNTTNTDEDIYLVSAWYNGNTLKEMTLNIFSSLGGSGDKTYIGETIIPDDLTEVTLKVFAFSSPTTMDNIGDALTFRGIYDSSKEVSRYEAESGVFKGNVAIKSGSSYSGGKCVTGFKATGDSCTFTINIKKTNHYNLNFRSAGDGGEKTNYIDIDGKRYGELKTPSTTLTDAIAERVYLEKGTHTVTVSSYWGWIFLDYLEVTTSVSVGEDVFDVSPVLVNANATQSTQKLMNLLCDNYGTNILAGQTCYKGMNGAEFNAIRNLTGKTPAVLGLDMMEYSPSRVAHGAKDDSVESAIAFDKAGGIVTFCWHWNAPEKFLINDSAHPWYKGFYTDAVTGLDLKAILQDKEGEDYKLIISDIDAIATQLKRLQAEDVPVLWRPLHEASGGWFWWGSAGADAYKELWTIMYDRLTGYHGLNNLIWVYNGQSASWYPGDEYVDIIGEDIYAGNNVHSSQYDMFSAAAKYTDTKKIVALTENGCVPDPDLMIRDGAMWSWFATWGGEYVINSSGEISESYTSKEMLRKVYAHDNVITLDELPDWK
ncbi:MAG: glycosyl hydrolase [Eubacteriales bacterium]|nr:glycosyl hydrolase [Eubacteriales bacterium]